MVAAKLSFLSSVGDKDTIKRADNKIKATFLFFIPGGSTFKHSLKSLILDDVLASLRWFPEALLMTKVFSTHNWLGIFPPR